MSYNFYGGQEYKTKRQLHWNMSSPSTYSFKNTGYISLIKNGIPLVALSGNLYCDEILKD